MLEPAGARVPGDPEAAQALARDGLCLGDELETGWYRGSEVQLDSVCLELITPGAAGAAAVPRGLRGAVPALRGRPQHDVV